jgi:hypothetical protein
LSASSGCDDAPAARLPEVQPVESRSPKVFSAAPPSGDPAGNVVPSNDDEVCAKESTFTNRIVDPSGTVTMGGANPPLLPNAVATTVEVVNEISIVVDEVVVVAPAFAAPADGAPGVHAARTASRRSEVDRTRRFLRPIVRRR